MIFSFSIGLCVDNDVDINNGNCVTDAVFEPAPIEISGNFKQYAMKITPAKFKNGQGRVIVLS
jgi:hypothetical protein